MFVDDTETPILAKHDFYKDIFLSPKSSVGTATVYEHESPIRTRRFCSPRRRGRLRGPPRPLSNEHRERFPADKASEAWSWPLISIYSRGQERWNYISVQLYVWSINSRKTFPFLPFKNAGIWKQTQHMLRTLSTVCVGYEFWQWKMTVEAYRVERFLRCLDNRQRDGGDASFMLYSPETFLFLTLVLISVTGWVNPWASWFWKNSLNW
jgi:hypothetical protein